MDGYGDLPNPGKSASILDFRNYCFSVGKMSTPAMDEAAWESVKGLSAMGYAAFRERQWDILLKNDYKSDSRSTEAPPCDSE